MMKALSSFLSVCLVVACLVILAPGQKAYAAETKITVSAAMVINESANGNPALLFDEQAAAGDPANGSGGSPTTPWFGGWSPSNYPLYAYIDLGQNYNLSNVYLYDSYSTGSFNVSAGSPGNWTALFTDPLVGYMTWNAHPVSVTTRYVRVNLVSGGDVDEIVLYGTPAGGSDTTAPGATSNLSAGSAASTSVQLTWTGAGDDGSTGTPASYDVRYSTAAITSANWASAAQATGEPAAAAAGTSRSFTVNGLSPSTTYYFALKTSDEVPNVSALSNVASAATTAATGTSGKIAITPSMYLNESGYGDPSALTDEQTIAGDPKNGTGGSPTHGWDLGYNSLYQPGSAVIDLGTNYALSNFYIYDSTGSGSVKVLTGTPFSWNLQFTDPMTTYNGWNAHALAVTTRYIQIIVDPGASLPEIVVYGTALGTPAAPPAPVAQTLPTMDQLIGINAFIDDPLDKMKVAGFVREYHNWQWDEGDLWPFGTIATGYPGYPNNQNKFAPSWGGGGGWNFDTYYSGLKAAGITASPVLTCSASWLTLGQCDKPIKNGSGRDPLLPTSYIEHADHMYQMAARYGSTAVADGKLKLASGQPRSTGLNTVKYYEDWNEQDGWWSGRAPYFNAYEYAAMASADYDGHQGTMGTTAGIKNADPNAKMAMGGLANPTLDTIKAIKFWSDFKRGGSVPFDALNIHHYSSNGSAGISPEADDLKGRLAELTDYRNRYMQGKEVWISEFGYDTNQGSPVHAPSIGTTSQYETQANWLVRSYLAAAAAGVDKAAMYMLRDVDANDATQYASSGLVTSQATGQTPKISWYYVYTLKNQLTGMRYAGEQSSGNGNVKIYKFKSATGNNGAYVIWSPTASNTTVNGYQLSLDGTANAASQVSMANGDTDGVSSSLSIASNKVTVNVSERPLFVLVNHIS
ncbi:fibronectin type III domain-containing protein [Paenibacillus sacheonensis]|uniref:Fibronectin type-III domain-containing protein n=1 Tax=Paenibacillus sacheonensis TaxID=742054 RepID=A0A7X5BYR0_9BACL|nr:hypothetical protein [Paenibacillus sacheonensis]MBM7565366.1 hypothetical protein [Paenibacillus sacheonensis]NBC69706.1 hypothetical protein [Paenibacillus sacheonensis]